jgi:hypothetical protein
MKIYIGDFYENLSSLLKLDKNIRLCTQRPTNNYDIMLLSSPWLEESFR